MRFHFDQGKSLHGGGSRHQVGSKGRQTKALPGRGESQLQNTLAKVAKDKNPVSEGYSPLKSVEAEGGEANESHADASTARVRVAEEDRPQVAASKAISILQKMERHGFCGIEGDSVYGAAVAMPQIARSSGWPGTLIALVVRIYFFTLINFLLQGFLLSMIGEEQLVMYPFAGQMHLCNFGSSIRSCPEGPDCTGPDGTIYSPPRLYSYDIWSTRKFVQDSMKAVWPEKAEEIDKAMDPGEYGVENYFCRMACVFIFMLAVVDDLAGTVMLARTLLYVPTQAESWVAYEPPTWAKKEEVKLIKDLGELDMVKFKVAGIPFHWKVINFAFIMLPKTLLWYALVKSGVHYLMETAGIVDVVVNAMALTFVLEVDEMVFNRFTTGLTKHIMGSIEDLPNFETSEEESQTEQEALDKFRETEIGSARWGAMKMVVPWRVLQVTALQILFVVDYYFSNCVRLEDGSIVSKPMHVPADMTYRPMQWMFGIETNLVEDAFWVMPGS